VWEDRPVNVIERLHFPLSGARPADPRSLRMCDLKHGIEPLTCSGVILEMVEGIIKPG